MKGDVNNSSWFQAIDDENNSSVYRGHKIHKGMNISAWFELEWDIKGDSKGPCVQVSLIKDESGNGK